MEKLLILLTFIFFTANCSQIVIKADSEQRANQTFENEMPLKVSVCELKQNPANYNQKLIEITGFVSYGFENFTIFDPECDVDQCVWLEFGGRAKSETVYCCGETPAVSRDKPLVVEKIPISLVDDDKFKTLDRLVKRPPDAIVHATIQGRFFSGEKMEGLKKTFYSGYGHMGMCSLLAIQKVIEVDSQENKDLNYRSTADTSELKNADSYEFLSPYDSKEQITLQQKADDGEREWSFTDHRRVAVNALSHLLKSDEKSFAQIKMTKNLTTEIVYKWRQKLTGDVYIVTVSRPYWLSFYAKDKNKVAWISSNIYKITSYQK